MLGPKFERLAGSKVLGSNLVVVPVSRFFLSKEENVSTFIIIVVDRNLRADAQFLSPDKGQ